MSCSCDEGEDTVSDINVVLCVPRSPSGERRSKKTMKIQSQRSSGPASGSPGPRPGSQEAEDSETETGEFSPANSGVDPNFLRKIKKATDLSKSDQEVS